MIVFFFVFVAVCWSACSDAIDYRGDSVDCIKCRYEVQQCQLTQPEVLNYFETILDNYGAPASALECRLDSSSVTWPCLEVAFPHPLTLSECLDAMYDNVTLAPSVEGDCSDCRTRSAVNDDRTQFTISTEQVTTGSRVGCACFANFSTPGTVQCPGGSGGRSSSAGSAAWNFFGIF